MSHKYVYLFSEGNASMRELLGGKGANLAEMTNIGLPVPQGFTISTEACTKYYEDGRKINDEIMAEIMKNVEVMEQIKDADILMTSFCGVTRAMLEAGKNLKLVFMMRSGWENCNVKAAKELGIPVYTELASASIDQSLDNIVEDVRNIGEIFNVQETANAYADELQERIDALMDKVSGQSGEPLKVLFMAGYADGTFVAYNSKMSSCMLNALNAENVLDKGGNGLTLENLVSMNPDIIVYVRADRFGAAAADAVEQLTANAVVQEVPAIANQKVIEMDYDDVMDYGARVIDSAETLYNFMYSAS